MVDTTQRIIDATRFILQLYRIDDILVIILGIRVAGNVIYILIVGVVLLHSACPLFVLFLNNYTNHLQSYVFKLQLLIKYILVWKCG